MRVEKRKEKAIFHKAITDLLTDCDNDRDYFQRLLWAQEVITRGLADFMDDEDEELE